MGDVTPVYFDGKLVGWDQVDDVDERTYRLLVAAGWGKTGAFAGLQREWAELDRKERARLEVSLLTPTWRRP